MAPAHPASTNPKDTQSLSDGVRLANSEVVLPWISFGTYKLGKTTARESTYQALREGYRCIDTAFIYGGETTETQVGLAIQDAVQERILERNQVIVQTKHWRKYHGYEPTLECLNLSLKRLQLDYIDIWLIHWPGPAWSTMTRRKDAIDEHGPWHYATHSKEDLPTLRADTWRAMETALKDGKVKSIGVSNFSIAHLERLKQTATVWPPAVNQIECHPLYPQEALLGYCAKEGIAVQAYASLGGQDAGKNFWQKLYPPTKGEAAATKMLNAPPVAALANHVSRTPAQVLLRWALEKNITVVPKASSPQRLKENRPIFDFSLTQEQIRELEHELAQRVQRAAETEGDTAENMARLCWRSDPLRMLDFD
jgi:diketogulonate reductase-like aldo/keto reductase